MKKEKNWLSYKRKEVLEMRPYVRGENVSHISITETDLMNGSPRVGDMIARNPKDHSDQWLVAQKYFEENLELVTLPRVPRGAARGFGTNTFGVVK